MRVLIIIPAYNEAPNIEKVVSNLTKTCPQYDYVIINDIEGLQPYKICVESGSTGKT